MPIHTRCAGCQQALRVADEHAGRLARCPNCNKIYRVPVPDGVTPAPRQPLRQPAAFNPLASIPLDDAPASPEPRSPADEDLYDTAYLPNTSGRANATAPAWPAPSMWLMRTPEGGVYGPVPRAELDVWVQEGRVSHDCELSEEGGQWIWADRLYPELVRRGTRADSSSNTLYVPGRPSQTSLPDYPRVASRSGVVNDRGATVLALAIMGWIVFCPLVSIAAWYMGTSDLRDMRAGRMSRTTEGMTKMGQILGGLHVGLAILVITLIVLGNM